MSKKFFVLYDDLNKMFGADKDGLSVMIEIIRSYQMRKKSRISVVTISNPDIESATLLSNGVVRRALERLENEYEFIFRSNSIEDNKPVRNIRIINKDIIDLYTLDWLLPSTLEECKTYSQEVKTLKESFYDTLNRFVSSQCKVTGTMVKASFGNIPIKNVVFMLIYSSIHYNEYKTHFVWDGSKYSMVKNLFQTTFRNKADNYSRESLEKVFNEVKEYSNSDSVFQALKNSKGSLIEKNRLSVTYYQDALTNVWGTK